MCWLSGVFPGTSFLLSSAFFPRRCLTAPHVHCLCWKGFLYITFTTKGGQMIVFVYTFIFSISLRSNKRIKESGQSCTLAVSFPKFWCVSIAASSVTVVLFSRGPCAHGNQIYVLKIIPCICRARNMLYMSVCVVSCCVYLLSEEI